MEQAVIKGGVGGGSFFSRKDGSHGEINQRGQKWRNVVERKVGEFGGGPTMTWKEMGGKGV